MTDDVHLCTVCEKPVERESGRGPWPRTHKECKAKARETPARSGARRNGTNARRRQSATENAAVEERDALAVIEEFELDFNLGNAVRYILEHDDGDMVENLNVARTYLDRAIARAEAAA